MDLISETSVDLSPKTLSELAKIIEKGSLPSEASQIILSIVPIIGVLFGSLLFLSLFYFFQKQKMLLIEKGIYKPMNLNWNLIFIVTGFIIAFSGLVITIVFLINKAYGFELLAGGLPLGIGIAIILSYLLSNKVSSDRK